MSQSTFTSTSLEIVSIVAGAAVTLWLGASLFFCSSVKVKNLLSAACQAVCLKASRFFPFQLFFCVG